MIYSAPRALTPYALYLVILLWLSSGISGFSILMKYENTPGKETQIQSRWPETLSFRYNHSRPTLVMFLHSRCPCSRASLTELLNLKSQLGDRIDAKVLFFVPKHEDAEWNDSSNWKLARSIPQVETLKDPDGIEAGKFGVVTSGHVLLYDKSGKLVFDGGITASRGQVGPSQGSQSIKDFVLTRNLSAVKTDVFGCEL